MPNNFLKNKNNVNIFGARVNNLKNINVSIPKDKLVVITGLSGSGKSSLAFDVIYAEGNRRYLEGMSSYARQFLDVSAKPDVDKVENLSPTISIDQRSLSRSPRSTVGTLTEVYDYLRVLYSKVGIPHCPHCQKSMERVSSAEILEELMKYPDNTQIAILARARNDERNDSEIIKSISQLGYARVRLNGKIMILHEALQKANDLTNSSIEIVIDRAILKKKNPDKERMLDSIETAFRLGKGTIIISIDHEKDFHYNDDFACPSCSFRLGEITPKHFSFNSPDGACLECSGLGFIKEVDIDLLIPNKKLTISEGAIMFWSKSGGRYNWGNGGLQLLRNLAEKYDFSLDVPVNQFSPQQLDLVLFGDRENLGVIPIMKKKYEESFNGGARSEIEKYMLEKTCPKCEGKRLKDEYLSVLILGKSIHEASSLDILKFLSFLKELEAAKWSAGKKKIANSLTKEMRDKALALKNVGLQYLSFSRSAMSISGGEGQRIRLATQIGSELMGITYVLDEPSIGLHNRDTQKLISTMSELKKAGNSLVVVEHDEKIIRSSEWIIDMGPGAGDQGGKVIFSGPFEKLLKSNTLTAKYLLGKEKILGKRKWRKGNGKFIEVIGASEHNLKNVDIKLPLGCLTVISGVSGSGKSTFVFDILSKALSKYFFNSKTPPGEHRKITGLQNIDKIISVNQSPIGRTPRSNAATYTGIFSLVREIFASTPEAKNRGFEASRFSFNMKGGRCEDCQGEGMKKIEMYLLPDMYIPCETCQGKRYNQKTLEIEYQGVNIAEVLDMSVSYALRFFSKHSQVVQKLKILEDVGLSYLKLGQSATNLSGGEAQRIKLATELARHSTGKTLYILDEPTIGLHFDDVKKLYQVLNALVDKGNSVIVVEHNIDFIRGADWVVDLGPDGGDKGGEVIYSGKPEGLKRCKRSWTGKYL
jgi:excinuclease ABC subunit A